MRIVLYVLVGEIYGCASYRQNVLKITSRISMMIARGSRDALYGITVLIDSPGVRTTQSEQSNGSPGLLARTGAATKSRQIPSSRFMVSPRLLPPLYSDRQSAWIRGFRSGSARLEHGKNEDESWPRSKPRRPASDES